MSDLFDQFMQSKIGLDLKRCNDEEMESIGKIYCELFDQYNVFHNKIFYDYYLRVRKNWEVFIYDIKYHALNAYKVKGVKTEYPDIKIISSHEMLENLNNSSINEDELAEVFD